MNKKTEPTSAISEQLPQQFPNSICETLLLLQQNKITIFELISMCLSSLKKHEKLNAYITVFDESMLLKAAKIADEYWKMGRARRLEGIPIAVKDVFCTVDFYIPQDNIDEYTKSLIKKAGSVPTTAGSLILKNYKPPQNSHVVQKLLNDGVIFIGKTNLDEFAMGSDGSTSYFGSCTSPHRHKLYPDKKITPGGSSSGSAVALSTKSCLAALGTDTGGSVRLPAAFCSLYGTKPSYGRTSRNNVISLCSSCDQPGIFTTSPDDADLLLGTCSGRDDKDCTSLDIPYISINSTTNEQMDKIDLTTKIKIGILKYNTDSLTISSEATRMTDAYIERISKIPNIDLQYIDIPNIEHVISLYYVFVSLEAASNLAKYDGVKYGLRICQPGDTITDMYRKTRGTGFGLEVKRRILLGTYILMNGFSNTDYYNKSVAIRQKLKQDLHDLFQKFDFIITPSSFGEPFTLESAQAMSAEEMYANDTFMTIANLAGLPAISIPIGLSVNELPIGLQIMSDYLCDHKLLKFTKHIESFIHNKQ